MKKKLKLLVYEHGLDKINTFTKYPSILTYHALGEKGRLTDELTTPDILNHNNLHITEKIDGTNVRIICWGSEYLIGSRKDILYYSGDLCHNPSMDIVDLVHELVNIPKDLDRLTVIYGELYGGKIGKNAKQYGKDKNGFRVFDVFQTKYCVHVPELNKSIEQISHWREHQSDKGIEYGQNFLDTYDLNLFCEVNKLNMVPFLKTDNALPTTHEDVWNYLHEILPETQVKLSEKAFGESEGIIVRDTYRNHIVKIRFEDYKRTLKNKQ